MSAMNEKCATVAARRSGAEQVLDLATEILDLANCVSSRAQARLDSVLRPDYPASPDVAPLDDLSALFINLQDRLIGIRGHLRDIDRTLDRLDL